MARMMIPLTQSEKNAVWRLAEIEKRDPRAQAALLIRNGLERLGFIEPIATPTTQNTETGEISR